MSSFSEEIYEIDQRINESEEIEMGENRIEQERNYLTEKEVNQLLEEMYGDSPINEEDRDDDDIKNDLLCLTGANNMMNYENLHYAIMCLQNTDHPYIARLRENLDSALECIRKVDSIIKQKIEYNMLKTKLMNLRYNETYISPFTGKKTKDIYDMAIDKLSAYINYGNDIHL